MSETPETLRSALQDDIETSDSNFAKTRSFLKDRHSVELPANIPLITDEIAGELLALTADNLLLPELLRKLQNRIIYIRPRLAFGNVTREIDVDPRMVTLERVSQDIQSLLAGLQISQTQETA